MQTETLVRAWVALAIAALALAVPTVASAHGNHGAVDHEPTAGDVKVNPHKKPKNGPTQAQVAATDTTTAIAASTETTPIGTVRLWPTVNFVTGGALFRSFELKAVGPKIELWLDTNLNFPSGDCRNDGRRNLITQEQLDYMQGQFDTNIYPRSSQLFSIAPDRAGTNGTLYTLLPAVFPKGYFSGAGDKIVTLITNIRDENFSTITFPSFVGGYHSSGINAFVDRHVMTIDSYDWEHRTGPNPPNDPSTELCLNRTSRPFNYEATFAHEYQHLLEFWASPGESTWVNEGLSDFAMNATGYARPAKTINDVGYEGHIQTFLGWRSLVTPANPIAQENGGAENSLTSWDDQGSLETLSDYGATWTFHELLFHRYGTAFMSDLHNEDANGIAGVQKVLDKYVTGKTVEQLIHEWAAMVALDSSLDDGANLRGRPDKATYSVPALHSSIHWANPQSYSTPGAPPNGSDYVQLRDAAGNPLTAAQVQSIAFAGARRHKLLPITWTAGATAGSRAGVLQSAAGNNLDRVILREIQVPASGATLSFQLRYGLEDQWDYVMAQVSTDGGKTWKSLANANTTTTHDPAARATIVANLPGFTGDSDWAEQTFDLAAYAGQTVLFALRNMTDGNTLGNGAAIPAGVWVDDVRVGSTLISDGTALDGWRSEVEAPAVNGFTVQLVGISTAGTHSSILSQVPLANGFDASLAGGALRRLLGDEVDLVGAIVTYDEPTEQITRYAPYELRVNGVLQPGG